MRAAAACALGDDVALWCHTITQQLCLTDPANQHVIAAAQHHIASKEQQQQQAAPTSEAKQVPAGAQQNCTGELLGSSDNSGSLIATTQMLGQHDSIGVQATGVQIPAMAEDGHAVGTGTPSAGGMSDGGDGSGGDAVHVALGQEVEEVPGGHVGDDDRPDSCQAAASSQAAGCDRGQQLSMGQQPGMTQQPGFGQSDSCGPDPSKSPQQCPRVVCLQGRLGLQRFCQKMQVTLQVNTLQALSCVCVLTPIVISALHDGNPVYFWFHMGTALRRVMAVFCSLPTAVA